MSVAAILIVPIAAQLIVWHLIDKNQRSRKLTDRARAIIDVEVRCVRVRPPYRVEILQGICLGSWMHSYNYVA